MIVLLHWLKRLFQGGSSKDPNWVKVNSHGLLAMPTGWKFKVKGEDHVYTLHEMRWWDMDGFDLICFDLSAYDQAGNIVFFSVAPREPEFRNCVRRYVKTRNIRVAANNQIPLRGNNP